MKILVVGSGGREHALCWAIAASPLVEMLYCAPGNAGIAAEAECVPIGADDVEGIVEFATEHAIEFVVVGPEAPLVAGLVDRLEATGIKAFGPSAEAAQLEASKGFTKDLCTKYGIPTAAYGRFTEIGPAKAFIRDNGAPIVVKADGLAAGKGVIIAETIAEAYSPAPIVTETMQAAVMERIITPTVEAMREEGAPYKGVLYAGLMIEDGEPKLLEFNVRFGDPECQVLMARLMSDVLPALIAARDGVLDMFDLRWHEDAALCVVMASEGYPGAYEKGSEISGLEAAGALDGVTVFHAGTRIEDGRVLADGGRVLGVTALRPTIAEAQARAYEAVGHVDWPQGFCRRDIGWRAI